MATANTIQIADAVVAWLNGGAFESAFTAVRKNLPVWLRDELTTLRVTVVPGGSERRGLNRSTDEWTHSIHIGIQTLVDGDDNAATDPLWRLGEQIIERLRSSLTLTLADGSGALWSGSDLRVASDARSLERGEWLQVVEVRYRTYP